MMRKGNKREHTLEVVAGLMALCGTVPADSTIEPFTFRNALEAALEWVFENTRLGWLFLIGIVLVMGKVAGWFGDVPWISVLWPSIVVVGTTLIVAVVFSAKYAVKVTVENELEGEEYRQMAYEGRKWIGSGVSGVILDMKWMKKQKSRS